MKYSTFLVFVSLWIPANKKRVEAPQDPNPSKLGNPASTGKCIGQLQQHRPLSLAPNDAQLRARRHHRDPRLPMAWSLATAGSTEATGTPANSAQPDPDNRKKQQDQAPEGMAEGNQLDGRARENEAKSAW
ncbi:hypothetical protein ON05_020585 [Acaryochloris sp. CCMEE 5410]|nr:hypothetical protein ON05_020585 [Acaryochloris sp. CCMEE 5410]